MDFECKDVVIFDDDGVAVYSGPRFLRCNRHAECGRLVTHGLLQAVGRCSCGNRTFAPALKVTIAERGQLLDGTIPTLPWEMAMIQGELNRVELPDDAA